MSDQGNWRKVLQERRLEHQLELQSRQIETVFSKHEVPAQVAGGYVQPRSIRFDLSAHLESGLERLRQITHELFAALGVPEGKLIREGDYWQLHIARPETPPVSLLDMLPLLPDLPPLTMVLGMAADGQPLLAALGDDDMPNMLVSGSDDAGKSSLLRSMALSLALTHKQSQLQLAVIDASTNGMFAAYTSLEPLSYLPHMLAPVAYEVDEYETMIGFLLNELAYRQEQQMKTPGIVVLVDEVVRLFSVITEKSREVVTQLLQRGPEVGIHLILTTDQPDSSVIGRTERSNMPLRLIGKVDTAQMAASAADLPGTQAEYLLGEGDFLAVVNGEMAHFQAAYIGDYDLHLTLETLHRNRPQPLLAQPLAVNQLATAVSQTTGDDTAQKFDVTHTGVRISDDEALLLFDDIN